MRRWICRKEGPVGMSVGHGCSFCAQVRSQLVRIFRPAVVTPRADVTNRERLREIPRPRRPGRDAPGPEERNGRDG